MNTCIYIFIRVHAYVYVFMCVNRNIYIQTCLHLYFYICLYTESCKITQTTPVNYNANFGFYSLHICNSFPLYEDPGSHCPIYPSLSEPRPSVTSAYLIAAGKSLACEVAPLALVTPHHQWMTALFIDDLWPLAGICGCSCRLSLDTSLHLTQALSPLLGCGGWGAILVPWGMQIL